MRKPLSFLVVNPRDVHEAPGEARCVPSDSQCGEFQCDCGAYSDAEVCTNGNTDVTDPTKKYRGCYANQYDCADNAGNPDDGCCMGWGPGVGDNIDHEACMTADAGWGQTCYTGWFDAPGGGS